MARTLDFLSHLHNIDVKVKLNNEQLDIDAPQGVLTAELRAELKERKAELMALLREAQDAVRTVPAIRTQPRKHHLPLSFSQQRMWLMDQLAPNNAALNVPAAVRLKGLLDLSALENSINGIVRRHEVLRTTFASLEKGIVQIIAPALKVPLTIIDLQKETAVEREARAQQLSVEEADRPFDLTNGPLMRTTLLRLADKEHILLLTLHHIVSDDASLNVFMRELTALYQAFSNGKPSPLAVLPVQYADFALWQREWVASKDSAGQVAYWQERLRGVTSVLEIPGDQVRPREQTHGRKRHTLMLPGSLAQKLKTLSRQEDATLFLSLLAAFKILLHQYSGHTEILVASPVTGRTQPEVEGLIGFFVNTVILRTNLTDDPTFRELLERVRETVFGAHAHQELPFEEVVRVLNFEGGAGQFRAFFNMLNASSQAMEIKLAGLEITPFFDFMVQSPKIGGGFDLTWIASERKESIYFDVSFNTDLFEATTIQWLLAHLQIILESIVADPNQRLSALPRLLPREYKQVQPRNTFTHFSKKEIEQSLPRRFEKQVEAHPNRIAVEADGKTLSYGDLNRAANRLARVVREQYDDRFKLSRTEQTRYARQILLWGIEAQEKLKSVTVCVAGAGGTGSPVIMQLALCGVGTIIVCDGDKVEMSNLNRQLLHDESRIGMNKALSAQLSVGRINPHVNVEVIQERITRDNVYEIVGDSAIIFDNVDDLEAKFVISECAVAKGIPHIISSLIDLSSYAAILHPPHTPCFHCLYDRNKLEDIRGLRKLTDNQHASNPVASPALFVSTGFACNEALKIILGLEDIAYNKYFFFNQRGADLATTHGHQIITFPFSKHFKHVCREQGFDWDKGWSGKFIEEITLARDLECPICGESAQGKKHSSFNIHMSKTTAMCEIPAQDSKDAWALNHQTVALLLGHSIETVTGILAVLKTGKIFITLDPNYPEQRLKDLLLDSEARLIITDKNHLSLAERIRNIINRHIRIINLDDLDANLSDANLLGYPEPDQIAYLIYTSGSTGRPKGCMQSHRNVLHFIMNYTNGLHICEADKLSLIPSFSFSAAMMDIFAALLNGAMLYLYDIVREGVEGLSQWLREKEITIYHSVPTVFRHFAARLTNGEAFPHLRLIDFGGERVSRIDVELYKKHFSAECLLVNGLGATELNVIRQYFINQQTEMRDDIMPVGYAVEHTKILLLDDQGHGVGFNRPGEIVIKSRYLAPGYWENADQTQAAFKPDLPGSGERLYYTGDLGRLRPDDCLEHLGRKDLQVKIRGARIEPAEIEVALLEIETIREAAVIAQENQAGEQYLTAYVVSEQAKAQFSEPELRRTLREKLPSYMIPSEFVLLSALPQTPTGKIDRRALLSSRKKQPNASQNYVAPRTPIEKTLADIVAAVLGLEQVSVTSDFFRLGGNSLLATRVVTRVRDTLDVDLPMRVLFQASTVAEMAEIVLQQKPERNELQELDEALKQIENLSEAQVEAAIAREISGD